MLPPVTGLAPLVPDHAAQHMQRGVGAHQLVPAFPVDLAVHGGADGGQRRPSSVCHTIVAFLAHVGHRRRRRACRCRVAGRRRSGRTRCGRERRRALGVDGRSPWRRSPAARRHADREGRSSPRSLHVSHSLARASFASFHSAGPRFGRYGTLAGGGTPPWLAQFGMPSVGVAVVAPGDGGTSSAGLRSKKPNGCSRKPGVLDRHDRPVLGPRGSG